MKARGVDRHAQLDRRWRPALMAFFVRRVRSRSEAEDLTQEVFVRLLDGDAAGQPDAYVFQVAQNLLRDDARKAAVRDRHRRGQIDDGDRAVDWLSPHDVAVARQRLATLVAALAAMPERTRAIFILYRLEHIGQEAIATTYGITVSAVKKQVAKAMAAVSVALRDAP